MAKTEESTEAVAGTPWTPELIKAFQAWCKGRWPIRCTESFGEWDGPNKFGYFTVQMHRRPDRGEKQPSADVCVCVATVTAKFHLPATGSPYVDEVHTAKAWIGKTGTCPTCTKY